MNFQKFAIKLGAMALLMSTTLIRLSYAQLHFTDLKGMRENILLAPGYEHYDPVGAFNLSKQGTLINSYNYPSSVNSSITDPVDDLIQNIFNAPAGTDSSAYFQVSPLASKFGRFLGPNAIGLILAELSTQSPEKTDLRELKLRLAEKIQSDPDYEHNQLELRKDHDKYILEFDQCRLDLKSLKDQAQPFRKGQRNTDNLYRRLRDQSAEASECAIEPKDLKKVEDNFRTLSKIINEGLSSGSLEGTTPSALNTEGKQHREIISLLGETNDFLGSSVIPSFNRRIKSKDSECSEIKKKIKTHDFKPEFMDQFLDRLLVSWSQEGTPKSKYTKHITERILLTLAWMNSESHNKRQFVQLYRHLPHVLDQKTLEGGLIREGKWLDDVFTKADYNRKMAELEKMRQNDQVEFFLNHPDYAAFLTFGKPFFDPKFLPQIGTQKIDFFHPKKNQIVKFHDCKDSSVLNFLALVLRNLSGTFDASVLDRKMQKKGFEIHPDLENFIKNHKEVCSLVTRSAHEKWAPIVSMVDKIQYVNGDYEMEPSFDNLFLILDHLLFRTEDRSIQLSSLSTAPEKMDRLCKYLSRQGFKISWELEGGNKNDLEDRVRRNAKASIVFKIEGQAAFVWMLNPFKHSEINISQISGVRSDIGRAASPFAKAIAGNYDSHSIQGQTLTWLANTSSLTDVRNELKLDPGSQNSLNFRYTFPLVDYAAKAETFKELLMSNDPTYLGAARKLFASIPTGDPHTQIRFLKVIYQQKRQNDFLDEIKYSIESFSSPESKSLALNLAISENIYELVYQMKETGFPANIETLKTIMTGINSSLKIRLPNDLAQWVFDQLEAKEIIKAVKGYEFVNFVKLKEDNFNHLFPSILEKTPELFLKFSGVEHPIIVLASSWCPEKQLLQVLRALPPEKTLLNGFPAGVLFTAASSNKLKAVQLMVQQLKSNPELMVNYNEFMKKHGFTPIRGALNCLMFTSDPSRLEILRLLATELPEKGAHIKYSKQLLEIENSTIRNEAIKILKESEN
jgi:hypothetical protein